MKSVTCLALIVAFIFLMGCNGNAQDSQDHKNYRVAKTEAQWKTELSPQEFHVLREAGTERAFSSQLLRISEPGTFVCAACGTPLYETRNKFESGTGWPSFDRPVDEKNVNYHPDPTAGFSATEVVCAGCGGHLGHVFNDGPRKTTGKRHCINGIAMDFIPKDEQGLIEE